MRKILSILMSLVALSSMASCSSDTPSETRESYTNPVLLLALLLSLVEDAGVSPSDITVYDAGRIFPDWMRELCGTGALEGVQFRYRDVGGSNDASADTNAPVLWSQEVSGETNYLPLCVTQADYLINLANLKGHVYGMTLCATTTVNSLKICQGKIVLPDLFDFAFPDNPQYNYVSLPTVSEMHTTPMQFPVLYTAAVFHLPVQIQKYMKKISVIVPVALGFIPVCNRHFQFFAYSF